jgi:hypothetical protein
LIILRQISVHICFNWKLYNMTLIYNIRHFKCTLFYWTDYLLPSSCWFLVDFYIVFWLTITTTRTYDVYSTLFLQYILFLLYDVFSQLFHHIVNLLKHLLNKKSKPWRSCCLGRGQIHMITSCVLFEADWPHSSASPSTTSTQKVL